MAKRVSTKPPSGMRDFLPEDLSRRHYVVQIVSRGLRTLRLRASRDAVDREPRDSHRQVRRGREAHLPDPAPGRGAQAGDREAAGDRALRRPPRRPGAAIRPDGAPGSGCGAVRRPPQVLQALPDPAGVASRPSRAGPLPRVLSVRRRHHGDDQSRGRGGGPGRWLRGPGPSRVRGLLVCPQPPRTPAVPDSDRGDRSLVGEHVTGGRGQARQDRDGRRAGRTRRARDRCRPGAPAVGTDPAGG